MILKKRNYNHSTVLLHAAWSEGRSHNRLPGRSSRTASVTAALVSLIPFQCELKKKLTEFGRACKMKSKSFPEALEKQKPCVQDLPIVDVSSVQANECRSVFNPLLCIISLSCSSVGDGAERYRMSCPICIDGPQTRKQ